MTTTQLNPADEAIAQDLKIARSKALSTLSDYWGTQGTRSLISTHLFTEKELERIVSIVVKFGRLKKSQERARHLPA